MLKTISTICVLALLSGTTAYYATKATVLEKNAARQPNSPTGVVEQSSPIPATVSPSAIPQPSATTQIASSLPAKLTPGEITITPTETYTVVSGDTLFPIGQKHQISWQTLARVNNLSEPYTLRIGQLLVIPTISSTKQVTVQFKPLPERITAASSTLTEATNQWRLDPLLVAQIENFTVFGLSRADDYRLTAKDDKVGSATVVATKVAGATISHFEIKLSQPTGNGSGKLWAVTSVTELD